MALPKAKIARSSLDARASRLDRDPGPRLATIEAIDDTGLVWVTLPGRPVVAARVSSHVDPADIRRAADQRGTGLVLMDPGDARPVLIGLIEERLRLPGPTRLEPRPPAVHHELRGDGAPLTVGARVDGRRVSISAEDEVVLSCGKASITLQRDGRVIVKGTRVETDAEGVNRIKGASVRIN